MQVSTPSVPRLISTRLPPLLCSLLRAAWEASRLPGTSTPCPSHPAAAGSPQVPQGPHVAAVRCASAAKRVQNYFAWGMHCACCNVRAVLLSWIRSQQCLSLTSLPQAARAVCSASTRSTRPPRPGRQHNQGPCQCCQCCATLLPSISASGQCQTAAVGVSFWPGQ